MSKVSLRAAALIAVSIVADAIPRQWSVLTRATLHGAMLIVTLGSLAIYGSIAFGPPRARTAAAFAVVPPASCLLTAVAVVTAALISRKQLRRVRSGR